MDIQPRSLIMKLLLGSEGATLSAREAVVSCAVFGIRENSTRVALVRLVAAGMLEPTIRGSYQIGTQGRAVAEDVSSWRRAETRVRKWSGAFTAVHCGGLPRDDRAALRQRERALNLLGFRALSGDLYVRPDNLVRGVGAVRERLQKLGLPPEAWVFLMDRLCPEQARAAGALWDGQALTRGYRETRQQLEKWLARAPKLPREQAARDSFLLGSDAIRQVVFDPLLPEPLVDVDERRAFVAAVQRFDHAGHQIWQELLSSVREASAARAPAMFETMEDG